ncbi:hypothetical protein [Agrobacterium tumefaciens]|uniref:hypothetical protein n=1 Tax=Agrobacterium tumefaciens TaxID=358 RepID=UPI0021FE1D34|nr:hypothetical protein FY157_19700 [Agrobacterium tumefaciens]
MAKVVPNTKRAKRETVFPRLDFVTLFDVSIDIQPTDDPIDSSLTYDVSITPTAGSLEDKFTFRCHIAVGRKKKDSDENFITIGASYGFLIDANELDEENLLHVAKLYAATSVWSSFSSLFSVVSQQMKVEFPPLPTFPGNVRVQPDDEIADEDEA